MQPLYLLYLDGYHQGDPLFLKELAQAFARAEAGHVPALLLHGSGEKVERTLEAEGVFPEEKDGVVQVKTPRQAALVERAAREANQELVALLTDEVVSTVGLQGCDRGLLRLSEDGHVETGALGWVEDLIKMRVVPVLSALAEDASDGRPKDGRPKEVPPARVANALAEALTGFEVTVAFFAKGALPEEKAAGSALLPEETLPEPAVAREVAEAGAPVLVTNIGSFFAEGGPQGLHVPGGDAPA